MFSGLVVRVSLAGKCNLYPTKPCCDLLEPNRVRKQERGPFVSSRSPCKSDRKRIDAEMHRGAAIDAAWIPSAHRATLREGRANLGDGSRHSHRGGPGPNAAE